jgi:formate C-acetyltransferase
MDKLEGELHAYFDTLHWEDPHAPYQSHIDAIWREMDRYAAEHPACPALLLKARLHETIAERFEPILFPHSPFYFEMGLRADCNWGVGRGRSAGAWLRERRQEAWVDPAARAGLRHMADLHLASPTVFDEDHRSLGTTRLLREGVHGLLARIAARIARRQADGLTEDERLFLQAAERSCRAVLRIGERFADQARQRLASPRLAPDTDAQARRFLEMIARTAGRVPAYPPETFYEGLAALWFLREVTATLEGIGISVVGHPDRQLIDLYRADRAAGRLTEDQARDLIARWMLPTDVRFRVREQPWPETSTCMELGGCDEEGRPVYNELTRLFLEVHHEQGLLNPKPNCRFDARSSAAYLDQVAGQILEGHNVFALQNDDVLIPALVRHGKTEHDARLYVNGGCQETICEGVEHSAGAYYYFSLPRVLDICLLGGPDGQRTLVFGKKPGFSVPAVIEDARDFEGFYGRFLLALQGAIAAGARWRRQGAARWDEVNPCPFYSSTLAGCVERGQDYTAGGARYNPSGIAPVGFATLVDSLYALRAAVYEESWVTLRELRQALRADWQGREGLRARLIALPKFGHGHPEVDALAARLSADLAARVRTLQNERGGTFQPSLFVYYQFVHMGRDVRATPDGRRAGEALSQGAGPGRLNPPASLTDVFHSASRVDYRDHPGNAVIDVQLPTGGRIAPQTLTALIHAFARMGGPTIQFNCVSVDELRDAQAHPERHRDLQVRICGLSAYFVALERAVQDEMIERATMGT